MTPADYRDRGPYASEDAFQLDVAQFLRRFVPEPQDGGPWWTAVNPKPGKGKFGAGLIKAMGARAGAPDFVFCWRGRFLGLELKLPVTGKLSPDQKEQFPLIEAAGGGVVVVRTMAALLDWLAVEGVPVRDRWELPSPGTSSGSTQPRAPSPEARPSALAEP